MPPRAPKIPPDASNAVFAGTSVISGTATIVICRTGGKTALGNLATSLAEKPPATDFAVGIRRFGMLIMRFTVLMVLFVLVVNISFHRPMLESLMFALALAVGLTPELLPMIVTVTLARSATANGQAKGDRQAPVRDPRSRRHERAVHRQDRHADGSHDQAGARDRRHAAPRARTPLPMPMSTASSRRGMKSPLDEAILAAHPFDMTGLEKDRRSAVRFRAAAGFGSGGARRRSVGLIVKGAPEDVLRLSSQYQDADGVVKPLDAERRADIQATLDGLGAQGFRALGIASRLADSTAATANRDRAVITDETDMVFAGFAVFLDPPKASAGATIRDLETAGVVVKVVTGDNELVSRHVFAEIGVP